MRNSDTPHEHDGSKRDSSSSKIFQGHGDHLDAIMDSGAFMMHYLPDIVQNAPIYNESICDVNLRGFCNGPAKIYALVAGNEEVKIQAMLASHNSKTIFTSVFPITEGYPVEVEIEEVIEWDNKMEATIRFSIGDKDLAFYASDYYCNKGKYLAGGKMTIKLSAIGINVKKGQAGFDLTGTDALNFLRKIGQAPDYDNEGNIKPIHFSMSKLLSYFPEESSPDMGAFQVPVSEISYCSVLDIQFVKCDMDIPTTTDLDTTVTIPLYFRHDFLPDVQAGTAVQGYLWMNGKIAE